MELMGLLWALQVMVGGLVVLVVLHETGQLDRPRS